MKELVVGNKDCSFNEIVLTISSYDHNEYGLARDWMILATALKTPAGEIYELEQDLILRRKNVMAVVTHLLMNWRQINANEAKFSTLLDILEVDCGWKDMAECLWKKFQKKMTENITWTDLDERSRKKVMESQVMFQGQLKSMRELCRVFGDCDVEALSGLTILQLLNSKVVSMTCDSIPEIPSYYAPRTVSSRRRISRDIFEQKCSNIFLVQDIDLSDLSAIAQNNPMAISSRQMDKVTSRFILLEFPQDFERIAQLCGNASVHWLQFKKGNFYWVKTHGSLNLILEYIHKDQQQLSEDEFLKELLEEQRRKLPVIIADVPGMGKTCFLANLCQKRKASCDDKTLVLFISLPEFLKDFGDLPEEISKENICKWIAENVSQNPFSQEIVSKMLQSEDHQVEIHFDAFDEVPFHQLPFIKRMIKCLAEQSTHVHITITTRVHKGRELEDMLNVLSYSLTPFLKNDQTLFFERYWASCGISVNTNLKSFANYLADKVASTLPSNECDVVGIPLQCYMLADIYQKDAAKYSNASSVPIHFCVNIHSVHHMYSALMEKRFSTCAEQEKIVLKQIHVTASINTVLTVPVKNFSLQYGTDLEKVNSLGILKAELAGDVLTFRFLHHSYAEFLLADFLVENLLLEEGNDSLEHDVVQSLLTKAFAVTDKDPNLYHAGDFETIHKNLCQLPEVEQIRKEWRKLANYLRISELNLAKAVFVLKKYRDQYHGQASPFDDPLLCILQLWREYGSPKLSQLLHALRSSDFPEAAEKLLKLMNAANIFQKSSLCFFINTRLFHKRFIKTSSVSHSLPSKINLNLRYEPIYLYNLLRSCLYHDFASLFETFSQCYLCGYSNAQLVETRRVSGRINWFLLVQVAAKHSSFNLVVKCYEFSEIMRNYELSESEPSTEHRMLPLCEAVIRGDFVIFDYLFKKFDASFSEMELLLSLCCKESLNQSEQVITEKIAIIRMITWVSKQKDPNINIASIYHYKLHPRLFECMVNEGAHLHDVEEHTGFTIAHNVAMHYSSEQFHMFVELLIKYKSIKMLCVCDKTKHTPLHFALETINIKVKTIELIAYHLRSCFNHSNFLNQTELFSAVIGLQNLQVLEAIVKCGGNPHRLAAWNKTILHLAVVSGNTAAISYFISLGCSVNATDDCWRTPLHYVCLEGERNVDEVIRVLLEHNANAKFRDILNQDALSYAKKKDKLWMLKQDTIDRLAKMSKMTLWDIPSLRIYEVATLGSFFLLLKNRMWIPLLLTMICRGFANRRRERIKNEMVEYNKRWQITRF